MYRRKVKLSKGLNNSFQKDINQNEPENTSIEIKKETPKNDILNDNNVIHSNEEKDKIINNDLFPKDFNDYINKSKKISHPIKDSKFIKTENKLKFYYYMEKIEIKNEKVVTIVFVGETGCGKSTLINAFLN